MLGELHSSREPFPHAACPNLLYPLLFYSAEQRLNLFVHHHRDTDFGDAHDELSVFPFGRPEETLSAVGAAVGFLGDFHEIRIQFSVAILVVNDGDAVFAVWNTLKYPNAAAVFDIKFLALDRLVKAILAWPSSDFRPVIVILSRAAPAL